MKDPYVSFKKKPLKLVQPDTIHTKYLNGICFLISHWSTQYFILRRMPNIANDHPNVQYLIGSSSWPEQAVWKGVVVCLCLVLKCHSGSILPQPQCIIEKLRFHLGFKAWKKCSLFSYNIQKADKVTNTIGILLDIVLLVLCMFINDPIQRYNIVLINKF